MKGDGVIMKKEVKSKKALFNLKTIQNSQVFSKLVAVSGLIVLLIYFGITTNNFFTMRNFVTIALQTSTIAFMGIGVTFTIITGGIDLGIGSVIALSGIVAGVLVQAGVPIWIAFIGAMICGILTGLFNGFLVTKIKLPPFIATLGMMLIARGLALQITGAKAIAGLPESFGALGNGAIFKVVAENGTVKFPGISYPVILMFAVAIIFGFILQKTKIGRYTYSVGSNEEASRLSGININKVKVIAYCFSGFLASLTGIVIMSRLVTAQPTAGVAYELDAIASAVIGGTSLMGGVGTISGTMIGAFIIGILRNGLNMQGVSSFIQQIIIGFVIIIAVGFDQLRNKKNH